MAADLYFRTIPELNQMLVKREISAEELAEAFHDRLQTLGPRLNAVATLTWKAAEEVVKNTDDELKRERLRGPLQGIPYGAKDLLAYPGYPTTWGARPFASQMLDFKATVLEKLESTGAPLLAKLAMVELAGAGGYQSAGASLQGPGRNPWNPDYWSGGSSSGSAAAVAAGLLPFALGSETSGSILTPAAFCGVTGLRPTYGYVSRHGAMPLSWTMDKIGPLCRTAEDCGHVLQVIAGGDTKDRGSAGKSFYYGPEYVGELAKLKIGFNPVDFEEWAEPAMRPAYQEALAVLRRLCPDWEETEVPAMPYGATVEAVASAEGSAAFEALVQSGQVEQLADPYQIAGLRTGLEIKSADYLRAMRIRARMQDECTPLFRKLDILITPTRMRTANRIGVSLLEPPSERPLPQKPGLSELIPLSNLLGWPALSLPCGFADGLPVGIQFVTRPFNENRILALGAAYQRETDWHLRRPPLADG